MYSRPARCRSGPPDPEGESGHGEIQCRYDRGLTDALDGHADFELGDFIDQGDVRDPRARVLIALVHPIHSQIPGDALRVGRAAFANGGGFRVRCGELAALALVSGGCAQSVDMAH